MMMMMMMVVMMMMMIMMMMFGAGSRSARIPQELIKQAPRWVQIKNFLKKQSRVDELPLARLLFPIIDLPSQQGDIMEQWGEDPLTMMILRVK